MSEITAIVVAAGQGSRMGTAAPKQYLTLGGRPLFVHALQTLQASALIKRVVLVVGSHEVAMVRSLLTPYPLGKVADIVAGGSSRAASVAHGLARLTADCALVAVHDGVRPFFTVDLLHRVIEAARLTGAAVPGVPVTDTIKLCDEHGQVISTPPRERLWAVQTPQVFRRDWLTEAHRAARGQATPATDDAGLLEWLGKPVQVVKGEYENIKLTTPEDLTLAENIWRRRQGQCG